MLGYYKTRRLQEDGCIEALEGREQETFMIRGIEKNQLECDAQPRQRTQSLPEIVTDDPYPVRQIQSGRILPNRFQGSWAEVYKNSRIATTT